MAFDTREGGGTDFGAIVIGTGFSGLGMAIRMKQEGIEDFVILERAGDVGGTWRDNHYPGCACDVQSHLYSFSFEQNPEWTRMFASQPEIWAYLRKCADDHGLRAHIRFGADVSGARWDDERGVWTVSTRDGRRFTAPVLISGMGGLSNPAIPKLPGIEKFQGKTFHSAQWDHDYDLTGKRVAVIGTGASAIQFVPRIQRQVRRLDLYQRTAPWIVPKPDRPVSEGERSVFRRFPGVQNAFRKALYWTMEARVLGFTADPRLMKLFEAVARRHLRRQVPNETLRRKLTPDYTIGCKRILISDDYYPALGQSNVEVVTSGVKEIRAHSIVDADGTERPVDAIVYGTGFQATDPLPRGVIFGKNGVDIVDVWKEGPEAYKGTTVAGFPNLFLLVGPNTGLGHNSMVFMIESQVRYVMGALRLMRERALSTVEVKPIVQAAFNERLRSKLDGAIWSVGGCRSWYVNDKGRNVTLWPGSTWSFRLQTRRFDAEHYFLGRGTDVRSTAAAANREIA